MTKAERLDYIQNKQSYIAMYMTIPLKKKFSLIQAVKDFFKNES